MRGTWLVVGALTLGCTKPTSSTPAAHPTAEATRAAWIEDDYAHALTDARMKHEPLVVGAWASWCHACLSLRAFVFPDPALQPVASRFVFVALDTEKPSNAPALAKLGQTAWPTIWVLDPESEQPALAWQGTVTAPELAAILQDAERALAHTAADGEAGAAADRGDRAAASGDHPTAIREYRGALAGGGADWGRRPRVVDALSRELVATKDWTACVDLGLAELPDMPPGTPRASTAVRSLACTHALPKRSSKRLDAAPLVTILRRTALDPNHPILADDRSSLFEALVAHYRLEGDAGSAKQLAKSWSAFLEEEAARAGDARARVVFDEHRLEADLLLDAPERAEAMLLASERDFPEDPTPPALLARAYVAQQKFGDALAALERALSRTEGPHRIHLLESKSDVLFAKGDKRAAKRALEDAIAYGEKLGVTGVYAQLVADLKQRAAKM